MLNSDPLLWEQWQVEERWKGKRDGMWCEKGEVLKRTGKVSYTTAIQLQFVSCSDDPSQGKTDLFTPLMLPT